MDGADSAKNVANYEKLKKDLEIQQKKNPSEIKDIENGNRRYYEQITPARIDGEMIGSRGVTEYNPSINKTRYWRETLDQDGKIRIVRPQTNDGVKIHYQFDKNSNYLGSDK